MMSQRDFIFQGMNGCSNHSCVVHGKRSGMGTNGACHCVQHATPTQLNILAQRLDHAINKYDETVRQQQSTIDRLTEALRPLANMADHFPTQRKFGNRPTSGNIYECDDSAGCHGITVEDCHSAKALLAEIEAGK